MSATERDATADRFPPATIPPEPFAAPLILKAPAHRWMAQLRDAVLTVLVWCGWFYLLVASLGTVWVPPFVQVLLPVSAPENPGPLILVVLLCLLAALILMGGMLGRALKDRRRFAGQDRRRETPEPSEPELLEALGVETLDLPALRAARRMVLHHGPDGRVVHAEFGDAPLPER
jgi:poly-beta-1,6-N-acetyl-D-glucosamine biosynthesis protein PgaD